MAPINPPILMIMVNKRLLAIVLPLRHQYGWEEHDDDGLGAEGHEGYDPQPYTVKRLYREGDLLRLRSENGDHEDLVVPAEDVKIQGCVV